MLLRSLHAVYGTKLIDDSMNTTYSFRFVDERLNRRLIGLLQKHKVRHSLGKDGAIRYSSMDTEVVEN